jgi:thymidylate kinase
VIRTALDALAREGIPFATRGEQPIDDPPRGGDVDILLGAADADDAERVLTATGMRRLVSPGHRRHRFFLAFDPDRGQWLKLDVSLVPRRFGWDLRARDERSLTRFAAYRTGTKASPGTAERVWSALARRRPLGWRRQGPVVAVLGPDGAGKGTVIARLRAEIPATVTPVYLGHGESGHPYARSAGPRAGRSVRTLARRGLALLPDTARDTQYRARRALRLSARAWRAWAYAWRGDVVLCDRYPLEALVVDAGDTRPGPRLEGWIISRLTPWPDAVVLLDAPAEVLYARKAGESSPERIERLRQGYRNLFGARCDTTVVPTTGDESASGEAAAAALWQALGKRRGW